MKKKIIAISTIIAILIAIIPIRKFAIENRKNEVIQNDVETDELGLKNNEIERDDNVEQNEQKMLVKDDIADKNANILGTYIYAEDCDIEFSDYEENNITIGVNEEISVVGMVDMFVDPEREFRPEEMERYISCYSDDESIVEVYGSLEDFRYEYERAVNNGMHFIDVRANIYIRAIKVGNTTIHIHLEGRDFDCDIQVVDYCTHIRKAHTYEHRPTCQKEGNNEYYQCHNCLKYLKEDKVTQTTPEDEILSKVDHNYVIKSDGTDHWNECSMCKDIKDKESHSFDGSTWGSDGTGHWQSCNYCSRLNFASHASTTVVSEEIEPTCTKTGSHLEKELCPVCGYILVDEHIVIDKEKGHTEGRTEREEIKPATCTKKGSYDEVVYCSVCGDEMSRTPRETELIDHSAASETWEYDRDNHWKACGCGVEVEKTAHLGGEPVQEHRVLATCTEEGSYDEVVYCTVCKCEMSRITKTIPKLTYEFIAGMNSEYEKNSTVPITFRVNGDFDKFEGIKIDEELIDSSNYTAKSGSTIVTLSEKYVSTLAEGVHKIAFVYDDGEIGTNFTIKGENESKDINKVDDVEDDNKNSIGPKTSDDSNMVLWISGLIISGMILLILFVVSKKGKTAKKSKH